MAHFAQLDKKNKVIQVIVVANEELMEDGVESEAKGIAFCKALLGEDTNWVQTSYNESFRKKFAGIDYTYDPIADHFFAPQPFLSWTLNDNADWEPPVPTPENTDTNTWRWNESSLSWEPIAIAP
jgi:hypothetical protein